MKIFGQHDENTIRQLQDVATRAERVALMADGHLGYVMPIGGVAAYRDQVSVVGVGFDIACGNAAIRTDLTLDGLGSDTREVGSTLNAVADEIQSAISFGVGRKNRADDAPVDHPLFEDAAWDALPAKERGNLREKARGQLGTVGSGNHYVDVFADEAGTLWVGVHFGSRGFGHTVASGFLALGQGRGWRERVPEREVLLPLAAPLGHDYWELMNLAGRYAYVGREWVARKVVSILGATEMELVHNHHNFCIPGDQKVPTPHGPKEMADVRVGDTVYAFEPDRGLVETAVLGHWCSGRRAVRTIRTSNRCIRASDEHPVLTVGVAPAQHPDRPWHGRRRGVYRWKRTAEIQVGDIVVCAESYYPRSGSVGVGRARLIGAMLGDGWVRHSRPELSGYTVGLAIGTANEAHTRRYLDLVRSELPEAAWRVGAPGAFGLTCSSAAVWREVEGWELTAYAPEKRVPAFAFRMPREEKLALLAGYFDSDGSVAGARTSNHGRGAIASVSRSLVEGLRELAIGCGLRVTPVGSEHRRTNFGECTVYRCVLDADSMASIDLWNESKAANQRATKFRRPQSLARSKIGYLDLPDRLFAQRVRSVDISEPEDVFDISVAHPSHSFVCEGIVVHNCWREEHEVGTDDERHMETLYVVRKGATPAFPGQKGFIGGSMGDDAVIVQGAGVGEDADPETVQTQQEALFSTVHGAGRVMSRTAAAGKRRWKTGEIISPGKVTPEMMQSWIAEKGVILRGGGLDESPHVYRRLPEVLAAQGSTVEVLHTLRPLVVVMAGANEFDPYKD